jgi:hypothetical protein
MIQPADDSLIYQEAPRQYLPSKYTRKSFTESEGSFLNAAKELETCIRVNERLRGTKYSWFATVVFEEILTIEVIRQTWAKVCRKLRSKGIEALWVIEPTEGNTVHFHIIVANDPGKQSLDQLLVWAMPDRSTVKWHKQVKKINNLGRLAKYITKGEQEHFHNGRKKTDAYGTKRLLFKQSLGLRKFGHIGKFWAKPKKAIWDEIKQDKARRVEILSNNRKLKHLVNSVVSMMPDISRTEIERRLLVNPDCTTLLEWAETKYDGYLASLDEK